MPNIAQELQVLTFPCLTDNYGFLVHCRETGMTAAIDTPDAAVISSQLDKHDWQLDYIFNTHHHHDHIGGNLALKQRYGCEVIASEYDRDRISGIDRTVADGDSVSLGRHQADIIAAPGHTLGHILYHFSDDDVLFAGDTLFALGCGRLFEGTPAQMFNSLARIKSLPDSTRVHCAHEYTEANAEFALSIDAHNQDLLRRYEHIRQLRKNNQATIPFMLEDDMKTNPFLLAPDVETFTERRQLKDNF